MRNIEQRLIQSRWFALAFGLRSHNYYYNSEGGRQKGHAPPPIGSTFCNANEKNNMSVAAIFELEG